MRVEHPATYWRESGFIEMVPTILPATTPDGQECVTVWLRLPEGALWQERWSTRENRHVPVYPPGTAAERIDLVGRSGAWEAADVRGTRFLPEGEEEFHVLRPDTSRPGQLVGFSWNRENTAAERLATRGMTHIACDDSPADIALLQKRNDCAHCHVPDKPGTRIEGAGDMPLRPTDGGGLYQILSVLRDDAEVNDVRGRDANVGAPYMQIRCSGGAAIVPHSDRGRIQPICPDKAEVPLGIYDLVAALHDGQDHARAVCESRRYLFDRADLSARHAFASAFAECGFDALQRQP